MYQDQQMEHFIFRGGRRGTTTMPPGRPRVPCPPKGEVDPFEELICVGFLNARRSQVGPFCRSVRACRSVSALSSSKRALSRSKRAFSMSEKNLSRSERALPKSHGTPTAPDWVLLGSRGPLGRNSNILLIFLFDPLQK